MVTYIYFVKCPNCEDEHFDFFDDAKAFAMGCISQKPVITQTEVNRNDFGECTDHCDLGTVWSWEDVVGKETEAEPTVSVFTKDDLKRMANGYDPNNDPEFATEDSEFRVIDEELVEDFGVSFNDKADKKEFFDLCSETGMYTAADLDRFMKDHDADDSNLLAKLRDYKDELESVDIDFEEAFHYDRLRDKEYDDALDALDRPLPEYRYTFDPETGKHTAVLVNRDQFTDAELKKLESCERQPIPEGMTIEELVEEMEENEDEVECTWCNELYGKDQCRYEVDLGWLCGRCEAAIKSRGETLTFRENNYWDFLDEELKLKTWICEFDGHEIGTVVASTEEEAYEAMEREYPEYHYGLYDGVAIVYPADEDELDENVKEIHDLGNEYDGGYPAEEPEIAEVSDSHLAPCPECGKDAFDTETGICVNCGFN